MLQKEFEERTKLNLSESEYAQVDALYLACGDDIDKDVFCKLYMDFDGRLELLHRIEREHQRVREKLEEQLLAADKGRSLLCDIADSLLDIESMLPAGEPAGTVAAEIEKKVWWLVGERGLVERKLKRGMKLSGGDVEYIINHLSK